MLTLSDNNQTDVIEAFNSVLRYLYDELNVDNPYFEQMLSQIYLSELQLNKVIFFILNPPFETDSSNVVLLLWITFSCVCLVFVMLSRLFLAAL